MTARRLSMSAFGTKRTFQSAQLMSAFGGKADIGVELATCRLRPISDTMAGMEFIVRQMGASDRAIWAEMRTALWPDETPPTHAKMVDELLADGDSGIAVGFAEIAVRKYANG